jgi:lipase maturation factor
MMSAASSDYFLTRWLFQRALAGIYLVGFAAAVNQFRPLLGARGLLPVPAFLQRVSFWSSPSLFHAHYSDSSAMVLAWTGVALSVLALSGFSENFGTPVSMMVWGLMWLLYLSFVNVGQTWYSFGWESLLLETGFLAIFLGARNVATPVIVVWLLRWVLFRLMFGAGLIKLRGDACWGDLTCLIYHYQSQPMPNPLSWYFHWLPVRIHKLGVLFNHFTELVVPFGYLVPLPQVLYVAGAFTIAFQGTLILSGNLSWLNYLTIVVAISCFDDALLSRLIPISPGSLQPLSGPHQIAVIGLLAGVAILSIYPIRNMLSPGQKMNASFEPFHIVNTYGAFGSVSRERDEVILEGTTDETITPQTVWREYEFKGKPGDLKRRPPLVAPYHMRLDWLMWFAGIDPRYAEPWMLPLVGRLLQNDPAVLGLLRTNPFAGRPPRLIRGRLYRYEFTTADEKRATGAYWKRTLLGEYLSPISLDTPGLVERLERQGWRR